MAALVDGKPPARIAVLGAGWWAQGWHLPDLHTNPETTIAAIVDPNPRPRSAIPPALEPLAALAAKYGCPTFASLDALLAAGVAFDGVVCCAPHASHYALGAAALAAGKHVLMEKPMTTDVGEAARLADAAARHPRLYFAVNNTASWRPQALAAAAWVRGGRVGTVEHVSCSFHSPLLWLFDDPANVGWTTPSGAMLGNGFAWGQMSHPIAWILQATGLEPSFATCAMTFAERSGADLTNAATIETKSGATVSLSGAGSVPGTAHGAGSVGKFVSIRIFGSEGMVSYEGDDSKPESGKLELSRRDGGHDVVDGFLFENFVQGGRGPESLLAFVAACRGEAAVAAIDAPLGAAVVRTIDAMYRSAKAGARVSIA